MERLPKRIGDALDAYSCECEVLAVDPGLALAAQAKLWIEAEIRLGLTSAARMALPVWLHEKGARRLSEMLASDTADADAHRSEYLARLTQRGQLRVARASSSVVGDSRGTGEVGRDGCIPLCAECGHSFPAHFTVHASGCIGRPDAPCGPDCRDECCAEGCRCTTYIPGGLRPVPSDGKESGR